MKDAGFLVLGETSGGGSCSVDSRITADGIPYKLSSTIRLQNANGENIDSGVTPHVSLVTTGDYGEKIYTELFNMETISAAFANFYGIDDSSSDSTPDSTNDSTESSSSTSISASTSDNPKTGKAAGATLVLTAVAAVMIAAKKRHNLK